MEFGFDLAVGLGIFIAVYAILISEKINKAYITLLGASTLIVFGILPQEEAFHAIDWNVIFLLISMMILVGVTKETGIFQYVAIKTAKFAKGDPFTILILMSLLTAVLSAFLDNVTTIMIIVPITIFISVELGLKPTPFIVIETLMSNIGGTATLIGDPPNIMVGSAGGISFLDFMVELGPLILIILFVSYFITRFLFKGSMTVSNSRKARIMDLDDSKAIEDVPLLKKSMVVLGLVILGFMFHGVIHVPPAAIALLGASTLMILAKKEPEEYFKEIEWVTIFFFMGLFILVDALVKLNVIAFFGTKLLEVSGGNVKITSMVLIWGSGIISGIVDNIPYVATMIPMIKVMSNSLDPESTKILWLSLSAGACLGGNLTIVGASANVVATGISAKSGYRISFKEFAKYGSIYTFASLIITSVYFYFRYLV